MYCVNDCLEARPLVIVAGGRRQVGQVRIEWESRRVEGVGKRRIGNRDLVRPKCTFICTYVCMYVVKWKKRTITNPRFHPELKILSPTDLYLPVLDAQVVLDTWLHRCRYLLVAGI